MKGYKQKITLLSGFSLEFKTKDNSKDIFFENKRRVETRIFFFKEFSTILLKTPYSLLRDTKKR